MQNFILALLICFLISVLIAPLIIKMTKKLKFGQNILHYVESHNKKQGTPTMGGLIFLFSVPIVSLFLFKNNSHFAIVCLTVFMGFGILGFLDDFIKIRLKRNLGLRPYQKIIGQLALSLILAIYVYNNPIIAGVNVPFSEFVIKMGFFIIPYIILLIIATSNSVNLTDGLDGLAGGVSFIFFIFFGVIVYLHSQAGGVSDIFSSQLSNIVIVCGAMAGGLLGFLAFNSYPAKIFMGDTGSLAIGAMIGAVGSVSGLSLYIPIMGFMFMLSTISVILQVLHYKRTKKRIFLMAPLHHHFEKKGCNETKIVAIYIIITLILSLLCIWLNLFLKGN